MKKWFGLVILVIWAIASPLASHWLRERQEEKNKEIQQCESQQTEKQEPIIEEPIEEEVKEPEPQVISLGVYKITAYCGCAKCCSKTDGITASGTHVIAGRTIAAPKEIPFGTKLMINGHVYTVEDRGGAIKGNRIDIYFETHEEATKFGVQHIEVFKVLD